MGSVLFRKTRLIPLGVERSLFIKAAVGVGAKVVALRLGEVGGQSVAAVGIVIRQSGTESQRGDAAVGSHADQCTQGGLSAVHFG